MDLKVSSYYELFRMELICPLKMTVLKKKSSPTLPAKVHLYFGCQIIGGKKKTNVDGS